MAHLPEGLELLSEDGHRAVCHVCNQQTILRKKTLTKSTVRALWLMNEKSSGTLSTKEIKEKLGAVLYATYTELKYWDLIKKFDGAWTITIIGKQFLQNGVQVPECLWVYNDQVREVPEIMQPRFVSFETLVPNIETTRESVASESIKIST